jgi:xylose isomerase
MTSHQKEHFPDVPRLEYSGSATAKDDKKQLGFQHYNPDEVILGKPMGEWLRFSVCFWHTFTGGGGQDPFGEKTYGRPWEADVADDPIEVRVAGCGRVLC